MLIRLVHLELSRTVTRLLGAVLSLGTAHLRTLVQLTYSGSFDNLGSLEVHDSLMFFGVFRENGSFDNFGDLEIHDSFGDAGALDLVDSLPSIGSLPMSGSLVQTVRFPSWFIRGIRYSQTA